MTAPKIPKKNKINLFRGLNIHTADELTPYRPLQTQTGVKKELIKRSLEILDDREIRIIKDRHLIEDTKTLDILGKELKISKERVRQIEKGAMMKLKSYIANSQSKDLLFS